jgi:hypothetical protein
VRVFTERDDVTVLTFTGVKQPVQPSWINEKLLFARVAWGRVLFTDLIFDVEREAWVYEEAARFGDAAFQQAQEACGGHCPCKTGAPVAGASEPRSNAPPPAGSPRLVGLLALPSVLNRDVPPSVARPPLAPPRAVPAYAVPADGAIVTRLENDADVETRETGYEVKAAVVYERREGWYLIGVRRDGGPQTAWVRAADAGEFEPVADILATRGTTHLTRGWDRRLWERPGDDASTRSVVDRPEQAGERDVQVFATRALDDELWVEVGVLAGDRCEGSGGEPGIATRGWVPMHTEDGTLNVWFHSRGC